MGAWFNLHPTRVVFHSTLPQAKTSHSFRLIVVFIKSFFNDLHHCDTDDFCHYRQTFLYAISFTDILHDST